MLVILLTMDLSLSSYNLRLGEHSSITYHIRRISAVYGVSNFYIKVNRYNLCLIYLIYYFILKLVNTLIIILKSNKLNYFNIKISIIM